MGDVTGMFHIENAVDAYLKSIKVSRKIPYERRVMTTSFRAMDDILGGFFPGKMYLLGARPGVGKTSLVTNIRDYHLMKGKKVVTFLLEMSATHLIERIIAGKFGLTIQDVMKLNWLREYHRDGYLEEQIMDYLGTVRQTNWWYYGSSHSHIDKIIETLTVHVNNDTIDFADLDHFNLIGVSDDRRQGLENAINRLANFVTTTLKFPMIIVVHLNRENESTADGRPIKLSNLRDTGALEQVADVVMTMHRPEMRDLQDPSLAGITEIHVLKNRQGPLGTIRLFFDKEKMTFTDITNPSQNYLLQI